MCALNVRVIGEKSCVTVTVGVFSVRFHLKRLRQIRCDISKNTEFSTMWKRFVYFESNDWNRNRFRRGGNLSIYSKSSSDVLCSLLARLENMCIFYDIDTFTIFSMMNQKWNEHRCEKKEHVTYINIDILVNAYEEGKKTPYTQNKTHVFNRHLNARKLMYSVYILCVCFFLFCPVFTALSTYILVYISLPLAECVPFHTIDLVELSSERSLLVLLFLYRPHHQKQFILFLWTN